jgi:hypothetical protein
MALDKLVDSSQLDSGLTSIADVIRAKSSGSGQLAFPAGFVSEIQAIPSGGNTPHEVPDGYTQLKYLESTGTQWIKTDISPSLELKLQVRGQRTVTTGYSSLAGCYSPIIYIPANNGAYATRFYNRFGTTSEVNIDNPIPLGTFEPPLITVDKTSAVFEADGFGAKTLALGATDLGTVHANTRISFFGRYSGSSDSCTKTSGRIYRAKIWDNGTLVGEYIPAMRNSDEVLGMYDIVGNTFYTNAGTGVFIGGTY